MEQLTSTLTRKKLQAGFVDWHKAALPVVRKGGEMIT
jgi:hypothetical protein